MKVITDRAADKGGCDGGINTAADGHHHFTVADLLLQRGDGVRNKMRRSPVLAAAANVDKEIVQNFFAFDGVVDLRVELQSVQRLSMAGGRLAECGYRNALGGA